MQSTQSDFVRKVGQALLPFVFSCLLATTFVGRLPRQLGAPQLRCTDWAFPASWPRFPGVRPAQTRVPALRRKTNWLFTRH